MIATVITVILLPTMIATVISHTNLPIIIATVITVILDYQQ